MAVSDRFRRAGRDQQLSAADCPALAATVQERAIPQLTAAGEKALLLGSTPHVQLVRPSALSSSDSAPCAWFASTAG